MTGATILTSAAALIGETDVTGYEEVGLAALNVTLAELFDLENRLRVKEQREPLKEIPVLKGLQEEVDYSVKLLLMCIPFGVAAKITAEDRDAAMLSYLHQSYINAQAEADRGYVTISGGVKFI